MNVALNLCLLSFAAPPPVRSFAADTSLIVCRLPLDDGSLYPSEARTPRAAGATVTVGTPVVVKFEQTESWQGRVVEAHWDLPLGHQLRSLLVAGLVPRYPEPLRRAGSAGRVVVEVVVDTAGRAEPGSVVIVASPDRQFTAAARDYVLHALFRPARVHGRAVRVLVRLPIDFAIVAAR